MKCRNRRNIDQSLARACLPRTSSSIMARLEAEHVNTGEVRLGTSFPHITARIDWTPGHCATMGTSKWVWK